jgi:hypothetical protein
VWWVVQCGAQLQGNAEMSSQVSTFWKRIVEPFFSITNMANITPTSVAPSPAATASAEVAAPPAAAATATGTGTTSAEVSLAPETETAPVSSESSSMGADTNAAVVVADGCGAAPNTLPSQPSGLDVLAQSSALLGMEENAAGEGERSPDPASAAGGSTTSGRLKAGGFDETDDDETMDAEGTDGSGR